MKKRILSIMVTVCMLLTMLPTAAFAANYSYTAGAFTIESAQELTGSDYSCQNYSDTNREYNYNVLTINTEKPITIKNTNSAQTHDSIVVASGVSANITLAGVNISTYVNAYHSTYHPALQIADDSTGNVTITLADGTTNTLIGGPTKAGLQKNGGTGTLTIQGGSQGTGTLYAEGGGYGAGIGGAQQCEGTNITISRAIVTAQGGLGGAGIGGGGSESGSSGQYGKASQITITDSIVTAQGGMNAAGIGGGNYGSLSSLRISGGSVKAIAGTGASTLGGGAQSNVGYTPPTDNGTGTGHQLYLLTIANPTGAAVKIDGEDYGHKQHGSGDTNLYVYLTGTEHTVYTTQTLKYTLEDKENVNAPELVSTHTHVDSDGNDSCDECQETTKTIKFDKNNDTSDSATMQSIVLDATENSYTLPECAFTAPAGKYFKGWATTSDGAVITGSSIEVSATMTLYAIWGNLYSITFHANGGTGTMDTETVKEGTVYTLPVYTFTPPANHYWLGWATSETGNVITDETIVVNENIDLYAIWKAMPFDGNQTILDVSKGKVQIGADSLDAYDSNGNHLTQPDYDGYIITGTSAFDSGIYVDITGGSHKITLRNLSISTTAEYVIAFMIADAQVELTLDGTNSLTSGTGYAALNLENKSATATLTITAASTGSLTADGGENAAGIGPTNGKTCGDITIAGGKIKIVDNNTQETNDIGVGRGGGTCGAITITGGSFAAGDTTAKTVYGVTVPAGYEVTQGSGDYPYQVIAVEHTVTLKANGGTGNDVVKSGFVGNYNLPDCPFTAPNGKQFKGWSTAADGEVIAGTTITVSANTDLYAIWEDIPVVTKYQVTVTNGTGGGEYAAGETVTITANAAPGSQQFTGWQVVSGGVTLANATQSTTTFTMPANAVEVEAMYEATHTHYICGETGTCTHAGDAHTTQVAYIALSENGESLTYTDENGDLKTIDSYTLPTGNYYLASDISQRLKFEKNATVNLCLNGKSAGPIGTITQEDYPNTTLTICDCVGTGTVKAGMSYAVTQYDGTLVIYGGNYGDSNRSNDAQTTALCIGGSNTLLCDCNATIYGGTFTGSGNDSTYGLRVTSGTATLYGGTFTGPKKAISLNSTTGSYTYASILADGYTYTDASGAVVTDETALASSATLTVVKGRSVPTIAFNSTTLAEKTYDGTTFDLPVADDLAITGAAYSDVVFTWTVVEGSLTNGNPVNTGKYTLTATIPANNDRVEASATRTYNITKVSLYKDNPPDIYWEDVVASSLVEQRLELPDYLAYGSYYISDTGYGNNYVQGGIHEHFSKVEIEGRTLIWSGSDTMVVGDDYSICVYLESVNYIWSCEVELEVTAYVPPVTVSSIAVNSTTHKTAYTVGDALDLTDLTILVTKSDSSTETVNVASGMVSDFDSTSAVDSQTLTITYEGVTTTYNISIAAAPVPTVTLTGIAVTTAPIKTVYTAGEVFDAAGMVITATYSDGTTKAVTNYTVEGGSDLDQGQTSVTIRYTEGDVTKTVDQAITVNAAPVETFTLTISGGGSGATGAGSYTEGTVVTISAGTKSNYTFSGWTSSNGGSFANASSASTTFTMPAGDVTITADWTYSGGGGGGGGGGGYTPPAKTEPELGNTGGWNEIQDELNDLSDQLDTGDLKPGETVTVEMNGATEVPKEVLEEIAGKDINVEFDMGGGVTWAVNGQDIPAGIGDLDLGVETGGNSIPVNVINTITGETDTVQLELSHNGSFGATIHLSVDLGHENRGFWANLYYFNEALKQLVFHHASRIEADGKASWPFDHASSYAIVIDNENHDPDWVNPFTDVEESDWFYSAVEYVNKHGLMAGYGNGLFGVDDATSRGMIVTILYRQEHSPAIEGTNPFTDVADGKYYRDAVVWAEQNGIVCGYGGGLFGPDDPITREQLASILWRYAKYKGYDVSVGEDTNILSYNDAFDISEYAIPAMQWACGAGVLQGDAGNLMPQGDAKRSHAAAMLMRFLESAKE